MINNMNILVLNDNDKDAEIIHNFLQKHQKNFSYKHVSKLEEFTLSLYEFKPDIILSDFTFQSYNASDVLKILNQKNPSIPFIIITEAIQERNILNLINTGVYDYIFKENLNRLPVIIKNVQNIIHTKIKTETNSTLLEATQSIAQIGGWEFNILKNELFWTAETYRIHDTSPEEFNPTVDAGINDFLPESRLIMSKAFQAALEKGEGYDLDLETLTTKGRHIYVRTSCEVTVKKGKPAKLTGTFQDISKQKKYEMALKEREEKFRQLFENMSQGVFYQLADGSLSDVNKAALDLFGLSREQFIGKSSYDPSWHVISENGEKILPENHPSMRALKTGKTVKDYTLGVFHPRLKKYIWLNINATPQFKQAENTPYQVFVTMQDVTERKNAEQERSNLTSLIDQSIDNIMITNTQGTIQYVNPAFERISGYKLDEVKDKSTNILKSGIHDDEFYKNLWETIKQGRMWSGLISNKAKNGSIFEEETFIFPIYDKNNTICNFGAIKRDTTEKHKMEEQLRQSQKMKAIGTLAGGIAHDFNNILNSISGFTELSMRHLATDSKEYSHLEQVIKASDLAADLVQQILTFSRQEEQNIHPLKIQFIIKEAMKFLRSSIPSTVEITDSIDKDCETILADPTQVHQIIMNLVTNSYHAIKENGFGKIEVTLENETIEEVNSFKSINLPSGKYIKLSVSDTGCGIASDKMHEIFEPYYTTKKKGEGTGLGLSIIYGIVKNYNGEIEVESTPGSGTIFKIYLPVFVEEDEDAIDLIEIEAIPRGTEHIMVVDDDEVLVNLNTTILESLGYKVSGFTSSLEALENYKKNPEIFDLLLTDMTMPDMTGSDLSREILSIRKDMPIIICTGFSDMINEEQAKELGIEDFLMKPMTIKNLSKSIRKGLNKNQLI